VVGGECRELGDDGSVADDAVLWRRLPPWALDRNGEPDSSNFVDKKHGELSVSLAALTTLDAALAGHEGFGVVSFTAADVRGLGDPPGRYVVRRAPLEGDEAHTVVCPRLSRGDAKRLRDRVAWVVGVS
jgi:hypothetical protein